MRACPTKYISNFCPKDYPRCFVDVNFVNWNLKSISPTHSTERFSLKKNGVLHKVYWNVWLVLCLPARLRLLAVQSICVYCITVFDLLFIQDLVCYTRSFKRFILLFGIGIVRIVCLHHFYWLNLVVIIIWVIIWAQFLCPILLPLI